MAVQEIPVFTQAIGFEMLTIDSTSGGKALTTSKYKNTNSAYALSSHVDARTAVITLAGTAGTNDIRWTVDGTPPVASTTGHLLIAGVAGTLTLRGIGNITNFRAIREGGTSGVIAVTYFV